MTVTVIEADARQAPAYLPSLAAPPEIRMAVIDILRGFAALAVVIYHARAEFTLGFRETWSTYGLQASPEILLSYLFTLFSLGGLGVPVFFVLSGYCIHRSAAFKLAQPSFEFGVWNFYWRRFWRIYPVYLAALLLVVLVDQLNTPDAGKDLVFNNNTMQTFLLNVLMLQEMLAPVFGSNTVFWTLSIEFHLYLFYPIILWLIKIHGPRVTLAFAAAVTLGTCFCYDVLNWDKIFIYAHGGSPLFLSHLLIWVAGAYLAEVEAGRAQMPGGGIWGAVWTCTWLVSFAIGAMLQQNGRFDWSPPFLAIGALGFVNFALYSIPVLRLHRGRLGIALVGLGLISYSLYATHRLSFGLIKFLGLSGKHASILPMLVCVATSVALAAVFFWFVERHSLRRRR